MNVSTQHLWDRAWVEVNLAKVRASARAVQVAADSADLLPITKADTCMLGAVKVGEAIESLDQWGY